jgi:hypothetical protein
MKNHSPVALGQLELHRIVADCVTEIAGIHSEGLLSGIPKGPKIDFPTGAMTMNRSTTGQPQCRPRQGWEQGRSGEAGPGSPRVNRPG